MSQSSQPPPPPTDDNPIMFETPIRSVPNRQGVRLVPQANTITWPHPVPSGMTRSNALELAAHLVALADEFAEGEPKWFPQLLARVRADQGE